MTDREKRRRARWERYFRKWWGLLITDSDWTLDVIGDLLLHPAIAAYQVDISRRMVTFSYSPLHTPNEAAACHEVVHVMLVGVERWLDRLKEELPEASRGLGGRIVHDVMEEATDKLARAFVRLRNGE